MNLTELARRLKISTKELKEKLPELGFHIGPKAIQIPDEQAELVIKKWNELKKLQALKEKFLKIKKTEEKKEVIEEKIVDLPPVITVHQLAEKLNLSVVRLISELLKQGVIATINDNLDYEIAAIIAEQFGFKTRKIDFEELERKSLKEKIQTLLQKKSKENLIPRPPVVVVMGHVDHGKTTLLDYIRKTNVAEKEAGAITQHIGAYQAEVESVTYGKKLITFIDTPGHEAFNAIRARGGQAADIAILVIAADDKIQPQTIESIKIIQECNLPFVVAINKIDKPEANVEKIKKELAELNLIPEDWGGKVICVPISAKTGQGVDNLLEMILLVADLEKEKLLADPNKEGVGVVIEAHKEKTEGPVATVIIYDGSISLKDNIIVSDVYGRVRVLKDFQGNLIEKAGPGTPVQILGLKDVPQVGDILEVITDQKEFKRRVKELEKKSKKVSFLEKVIKEKPKEVKFLNIILRADVLSSLDAITTALKKLEVPEVKIKFVKKGLGEISDNDIELARSSNAWVIGFNVGISKAAKILAEEAKIEINLFNVIYQLIEKTKEKMQSLVEPEIIEKVLGKAEVLVIFRKMPSQMIIGARVMEGEIKKGAKIRIWRKDELVGEGILAQLQINKIDVERAVASNECGIRFEGNFNLEVNDILEVYEEEKIEKKIFNQ
jgi:translation initiation factor IF-2